ncbi:MAG: hypothetical protein HYV13_01345 [Candidatus Doudnabacteria bacterium]|nr:hypothetical protein [Candidatus Doudnabacteria bacterium]
MRLKDYFLASETNDYQPWITKPVALFSFCLIIWALRLLLPSAFTFASPGIDAGVLMDKINQERTNRFIPSLVTNSKLIAAAASKSNDMLTRSYFAHVDPDGNYVWYRIENAGYKPYLTLGENLAIDFNDAQSVIEAWMNSPTHRANIVNEKFQDQGLASIYGLYEPGHSTIAITSLFGALLKKSSPPPPPPAAASKPKPPPPPSSLATKPPPTPQPAPPPPAPQQPENKPTVTINPDIKLTKKIIDEELIFELDVVVSGSPSMVKASLKDKTIELLPSAIVGQFLGVFTFPKQSDFSSEKIKISAVDKNGTETSSEFEIGDLPSADYAVTGTVSPASEYHFIKILKIIFSVFALIYLVFLIIDSIIIHRAKIKRTTIHSSPHSLLFLLIVLVNLISIWV